MVLSLLLGRLTVAFKGDIQTQRVELYRTESIPTCPVDFTYSLVDGCCVRDATEDVAYTCSGRGRFDESEQMCVCESDALKTCPSGSKRVRGGCMVKEETLSFVACGRDEVQPTEEGECAVAMQSEPKLICGFEEDLVGGVCKSWRLREDLAEYSCSNGWDLVINEDGIAQCTRDEPVKCEGSDMELEDLEHDQLVEELQGRRLCDNCAKAEKLRVIRPVHACELSDCRHKLSKKIHSKSEKKKGFMEEQEADVCIRSTYIDPKVKCGVGSLKRGGACKERAQRPADFACDDPASTIQDGICVHVEFQSPKTYCHDLDSVLLCDDSGDCICERTVTVPLQYQCPEGQTLSEADTCFSRFDPEPYCINDDFVMVGDLCLGVERRPVTWEYQITYHETEECKSDSSNRCIIEVKKVRKHRVKHDN